MNKCAQSFKSMELRMIRLEWYNCIDLNLLIVNNQIKCTINYNNCKI